MIGFAIIPITAPKTMCRNMVIAGTSGAMFSPAIPAPKAGNSQSHTVVAVTITPKMIPCINILPFMILVEIGKKTYPKNNVNPIPFAIWNTCPMICADSCSPATICPRTTEMSRGTPVIAISPKAAI